ncbi:MAG: HIT family protein [Simkaniaceae bacterium]|nr:HIT family protein [Simkaniaceae bacterium]
MLKIQGMILFFGCWIVSLGAEPYCAFCDPKILEKQTFYEGEFVLALCTHRPVLPGHVLIIPKRHVERFEMLSDEEMVEMGHVIKKINGVVSQEFKTISYLLLQKNGKEVGQTVPHVHFHYIPRKEGENSGVALMAKMLLNNLKSPISLQEMELTTERMREIVMSE